MNAAQRRHLAGAPKPELAVGPKVAALGTKTAQQTETALKKELLYLGDAVKLADHIQYTLRCENPEKALELCRLASRTTQCIVSWNHCINWHLQRGKPGEAMDIYNEMKKRAQFPDSYTYVILMRGLALESQKRSKIQGNDPAECVVRAVSLYNSMDSPTSRVKPTIIHTNAALRVCSFSKDLDAFWGIASKIPKFGPASADHVTYTTILTAIRHGVLSRPLEDASQIQEDTMRRKAVHEGRKVWGDIIARWRGGEVQIDEKLVASMANVLLLSPDIEDWDDVLSLIQQTMQVERLLPPVGSPDRNTGHVLQRKSNGGILVMEAEETEDDGVPTQPPAAKVFRVVKALPYDPAKPQRPRSLAYLTPGNQTLSVIIHACSAMEAPATAIAYWELFSLDPINIKPDLANFHGLLKFLARSRSSRRATRLLREDIPRAGISPTGLTFHLAMGTCLRDHKNKNSLEYAGELIDLMGARLAEPDVHVMESYLNLAMASGNGARMATALNRLDPMVHEMQSRVNYGSEKKIGRQKHLTEKTQMVGLMQRMVGVIDKLRDFPGAIEGQHGHWTAKRTQLTRFIGDAKVKLTDSGALVPQIHQRVARSPVRTVRSAMRDREWATSPSPISEFAAGMDRSSPELMRWRTKGDNFGKRERAERRAAIEAGGDAISWRNNKYNS